MKTDFNSFKSSQVKSTLYWKLNGEFSNGPLTENYCRYIVSNIHLDMGNLEHWKVDFAECAIVHEVPLNMCANGFFL